MRGFDPYLIARVQRAGSHYFDADTLRFFDAYGGASRHYAVPGEPPYLYALVESVKPPYGPRFYRVVVVEFLDDGTVDIRRIADNLTASTANRTLSRLTHADALTDPDVT